MSGRCIRKYIWTTLSSVSGGDLNVSGDQCLRQRNLVTNPTFRWRNKLEPKLEIFLAHRVFETCLMVFRQSKINSENKFPDAFDHPLCKQYLFCLLWHLSLGFSGCLFLPAVETSSCFFSDLYWAVDWFPLSWPWNQMVWPASKQWLLPTLSQRLLPAQLG